jgi:signal transduction histidine kinase
MDCAEALAPSHPFNGAGEMRGLMRRFDWASTSLGPMSSWSRSLRTGLHLCLGSRLCECIYWGAEHLVLYNTAYCSLLGTKHPWALALPAATVWPEIFPSLGPLLEECFRTGVTMWAEDALYPLNRRGFLEECYLSYSCAPLINEFEQVEGVFTTLVDTSARVIGERRLRILQSLGSRVRQIQSPESALSVAGRVIAQNLDDIPFASMYLWDEETRVARLSAVANISEATPTFPGIIRSDEPGIWSELAALSKGQQIEVREVVGEQKAVSATSWKLTPEKVVMLPLSSEVEGGPRGFIVAGVSPHALLDKEYLNFFQMLADQVAGSMAEAYVHQQEESRARALAELDQAKTTFFSNVSHELRTPLTLILGPLEEALKSAEGSLTEEQLSALGIVKRNALRLLKLVNALLDFSRLEAGRLHARVEPTDLSAYTIQVATSFEWAAKKAGLRFIIDCHGLDEPVYVDRDMWMKIVLNLLSNAFKYTLFGEIRIALRKAGTSAVLTVSDTGVGIPKEQLPRIFERFYRVEGSGGRTREGAGIGLALVLELIKQHGGSVAANSIEGQGSVFTVHVPLGCTHLQKEAAAAELSELPVPIAAEAYVEEACGPIHSIAPSSLVSDDALLSERAVQRNWPGSKRRVLLADDNYDMRQYVSRTLSHQFEVEAVTDGLMALRAAQRECPDLVVADIMMPKLDGVGLLLELRRDPSTRAIPVILLTARAAEESKIEALEQGADDYLIKPFSARELVARVNSAITLSQIRKTAGQQAERVRIARDLHDTLLQSVQGMCFLLEAGLQKLQSDQKSAMELFRNVLDASKQAVSEGRSVLSLLRLSAPYANDLVECLTVLGNDLLSDRRIKLLVEVTGRRRELKPNVWTEVYKICREAVANAAQHSGARTVIVKLTYRTNFEVSIVDDGCGITPGLIAHGREGHFGLKGMHERAACLGARLALERVRVRGTRVRLTMAGITAYAIEESPNDERES